MLDKTFRKLGEAFDAMREEMREIADERLVVRVKDGNVEITGDLKELRINGKLIRFARKV